MPMCFIDIWQPCYILIMLFPQTEVKKAYGLLYKFFLLGTLLLLGNGVHREAKKLWKWFAFILKFKTSSLFIKSARM